MGTLFIVSTPIGNLEDISIRAIKTLLTVDIVAAEDTRRTGLLLSEIDKKYTNLLNITINEKLTLISFYDEIEANRTAELIEKLKLGKNVALVSDAGTPLISDPGYRFVNECLKNNILVSSIPGSCAAISALVTSGLATHQFQFLGYPPEKTGKRQQMLRDLWETRKILHQTLIIYVAPHKLEHTLQDILNVFGDIDIVISREITKIYENTWSGKVSLALQNISVFKGELVLLF
jgi:16S rRNA (cytidine1402-2'-O)-methyltransferase